MIFALLIAASVADDVVQSLNEPGCENLGALYADSMRKAVPDVERVAFCVSLRSAKGRLLRATPAGREGGWQLFVVDAERGRWRMKLAVNDAGRIEGFAITDDVPPLAVVKRALRWPLARAGAAESLVFWGGDDVKDNYHVATPRQRRALDVCAIDASGKTHRGEGRANADYFIYGAEVVAAADGIVTFAIDGIPDNAPPEMNADYVSGNLVVVDHGNGEHAHYAHLQPGSLRVKRGQRVQAGDVLALVGNSGNSSEPHLHFHVQDHAWLTSGYGVDVVFDGVVVNGSKRDGHRPKKGERIR